MKIFADSYSSPKIAYKAQRIADSISEFIDELKYADDSSSCITKDELDVLWEANQILLDFDMQYTTLKRNN